MWGENKMEHYDVIIVGAGIAGSGLAYNLNREGYKGSVLVIDKDGAGIKMGLGVILHTAIEIQRMM
jgi:flavin-dependent dehydrogenase